MRIGAFEYRNGTAWAGTASLEEVASSAGTPTYVYSRAGIDAKCGELASAFAGTPHLLCYAVKANGNLALLRRFAHHGFGFDIVSGGELYRVLHAGGRADRIVFAGVGKREEEIAQALEAGILMFNVESREELFAIDRVARARARRAPVALRVNPDVDPKTHRYITTGKQQNKFGLDPVDAAEALREASRMGGVEVIGLHMHIGSQITSVEPYRTALERLLAFARETPGTQSARWINTGGGFGISYRPGEALPASAFAQAICPLLKGTPYQLLLEQGRFLVAEAGALLTRVQYVKETPSRRYLICDAGMNDLIRPPLYEAYHPIWPVRCGTGPLEIPEGEAPATDVVGPICESADFLGLDRRLPPVRAGDLLAVFHAGAYGFAMSSQYNGHPRAAEVLVEDGSWRIVRRRETYEDLTRGEEP